MAGRMVRVGPGERAVAPHALPHRMRRRRGMRRRIALPAARWARRSDLKETEWRHMRTFGLQRATARTVSMGRKTHGMWQANCRSPLSTRCRFTDVEHAQREDAEKSAGRDWRSLETAAIHEKM